MLLYKDEIKLYLYSTLLCKIIEKNLVVQLYDSDDKIFDFFVLQ